MELLSGLIKYSFDTRNNWEVVNPILPLRTLCFSIDGTEVKLKIGDGIQPWNAIPYFSDQLDVIGNLSTLGLVNRSLLGDLNIGTDDTKYITPALLLTYLRKKYSGDTFILTPGSNIYRAVDEETYIIVSEYPPLRPYGTSEPAQGERIPDIAFRMEHKGSCTLSYQQRKGQGYTYVRIAKNLEVLDEQPAASSSYRTYTYNISFVPGDIIQVQGRDISFIGTGRIRNVRLLVSNIP